MRGVVIMAASTVYTVRVHVRMTPETDEQDLSAITTVITEAVSECLRALPEVVEVGHCNVSRQSSYGAMKRSSAARLRYAGHFNHNKEFKSKLS